MKSIAGVEIFSVGCWNGDDYSQKDLDHMVAAFNDASIKFRPPLKLGHTENQSLVQQDGLPAAGWIGNLYTKAGKLLADFVDIPDKIFDLIVKGAYKNRSAEIIWNCEINGKKFPRMLSAVALLGADMPAVTNLADIHALYSIVAEQIKSYSFKDESLIIRNYNYHEEGNLMSKTESEIKLELELETEKKKAAELAEQNKSYQKDLEDKDNELEELKKFKAEAAAKALADAQALAEAELDKELATLQGEKLISPSMKPYVKALLSEEKKEYSIKGKTKEEKFSKSGLLKEILKLHSAIASVNFEESSDANKKDGETDEALNSQIAQYAKEHNVTYTAAYKAVLKTVKKTA